MCRSNASIIQKRIIPLMLTFLLPLTACSQTETVSSVTTANVTNDAMNVITQSEVTPGVLQGQTIEYVSQWDGSSCLINTKDEEGKNYAFRYDGNTCTPIEGSPTFSSTNSESENQTVFSDTDGHWWKVDGENIITCTDTAGNSKTLSALENIDKSALTFSGVRDDGSGSVCFSFLAADDTLYWIITDTQTCTVKQTINAQENDYSPYIFENKLYVYNAYRKAINVYDLSSGLKDTSYDIPCSSPLRSFCISEDGITFVTNEGIYRTAFGGDLLQTISESPGYAYADVDSNNLFIFQRENEYYIICNIGGSGKIYKYSVGSSVEDSVPNELTIWSLQDSDALRIAANEFGKQYPDCTINIIIGESTSASSETEDIIKEVNTMILSDDSPDVIILDGLPTQEYISKGVLKNLSGLIDDSDYYSSIINAYQDDRGDIYAYPAFFCAPIMLGADSMALSEVNSPDQILSLFKESQCYINGYRDVFDTFYPTMSSDFCQDNTLNEEKLREFLDFTNELVQTMNITSEVPDSGAEGGGSSAYGGAQNGQSSLKAFQVATTQVATSKAYALTDIILCMREHENFVAIPLLGNYFEPMMSMAIPINATNQSAAESFIKVVLSDSVQSNAYGLGLAVKKGVELNKYSENMKDHADLLAAYKSNPLEFDWDTLFESYSMPANEDIVIEDIIYSEALSLYRGETSLDEAMRQISDKLTLYFMEKM